MKPDVGLTPPHLPLPVLSASCPATLQERVTAELVHGPVHPYPSRLGSTCRGPDGTCCGLSMAPHSGWRLVWGPLRKKLSGVLVPGCVSGDLVLNSILMSDLGPVS